MILQTRCLANADIRYKEDFEAGLIAAADFKHESHIYLAWIYLNIYSLDETLRHFGDALKKFAAANDAADLYHATITWAYIFLINERMQADPESNWETFKSAHADLFAPKLGALDRYYSKEFLHSPRAKAIFLMPDQT